MANIAVDRLIVDIEARTKQFEAGLRRVEKQVSDSSRKMEKSFAGVNSQIASAGATLVKTFGVTVGVGMLSQLPRMISASVSAIGDLSEAATKAGVSIRDLQRVQYAGIGSGLGLDQIVAGLGRFNKNIAEAATKGGDLAKLFEANNIPLKDQNGNLRSTVDLLSDVADLVKNARNEQDKMLIATTAGGKSFAEWLPLLNDGGASLKQFMKYAEDAGFVISDKLVKPADELSDKLARSEATLKNIWSATLAGTPGLFARDIEDLMKIDEWVRKISGNRVGLFPGETSLRDIVSPEGKAGREQAQRRADAEAHARQLEAGWRDRVTEREMLRQTPDLDELGQRRLKILDEEIERYERLIAAHKKFIDTLRVDGQPDVRPPPGTNRGGTVVPDKAAEDAAKAKADAAHKKSLEDQNALLKRQKKTLDDILEREEAIGEAAGAVTDGLRDVTMSAMDDESSVGDSVLSMLKTIQKQLVDAFLFGGGPFAELFRTKGQNGAPGGIIGNAITKLVERNADGIYPKPVMPHDGVTNALSPSAASPLVKDILSTVTGAKSGGGALAALTGSGSLSAVGNFVARGAGNVDPRLRDILTLAAERSGMSVQAFSGYRPGSKGFHGKGLATDVSLLGADGKALPNYQNAGSFRAYEMFAQHARTVQMEKYPELAKDFRWGGYFSGGKGKYGAMDLMHFDLGGSKVGIGGGSWANGLNQQQARLWPGAQSIGMSGNWQGAPVQVAQAGQKLATSLASTAAVTQQAGSGFAGQFTSGLQSILSSITATPATGAGGGIGGLLGKLFGFAEGGQVRGPGSGKSDSIFAMLSDGEFVVNSEAAGRHSALLEAINNGRLSHFAGGGSVGSHTGSGGNSFGMAMENYASRFGSHGGNVGGNPRLPAYAASSGSMSGGGRGGNITIINQAGVDITPRRTNGIDGEGIELLIRKRNAEMLREDLPRVLRDGYGLKPQLTNRF